MTHTDLASDHEVSTLTFTSLPRNAEILALMHIYSEGKYSRCIHISTNQQEMERMAALIAWFMPNLTCICFPAWDCLPFDRVSPKPEIMAERSAVLYRLLQETDATKPLVLLTTANAITQRVLPKEVLSTTCMELANNSEATLDRLRNFLARAGYRRTVKAIEAGEYALRGGIVDIIPAGHALGVRLDYFGDELESIHWFDPITQLRGSSCETITLLPASEVLLNEDTIAEFRSNYRKQFGAISKSNLMYEAITNQQAVQGMEHYLPLFYTHVATLFDYCGDAAILQSYEAADAVKERQESTQDYYTTRKQYENVGDTPYSPLPPEMLYLMEAHWEVHMARKSQFFSTAYADATSNSVSQKLPVSAGRNLVQERLTGEKDPYKQLLLLQQSLKKNIIICGVSEGSTLRMESLMKEHHLTVQKIDDWNDLPAKTPGLCITYLPIESGFDTPHAMFIAEQDWLGERIGRTKSKKRDSRIFMEEAASFNIDEYVVHREHGIGKFAGLETLTAAGITHDCIKLLYAGDDRLFVPVENMDVLSRYGSDEDGAVLDKLGSASWQKRKAAMKQRITLAATELMKTAAARLLKAAPELEGDANAYELFCSRFPFSETEDQERAIEEVRADLGSGKPMDRLICGDVGFGKTEVALRAAFIAATSEDKGQVALICPTTLLARQHYQNFKKRFEGFNLRVAQLSRIVPARTQKEVKEQLAEGQVDIIIGTHALLAKTIDIANLKLLIVDEEQHFGVAQKERLKNLKAEVHVLTLTATPIPRTLQLSLTGVRDLSLITTPPVDRLAVRSFVMPFDPAVLREAILREKHRGGQVFLVTPKIKEIAELKARLAELVPEARMCVAHGQMAPADLDTLMNDFYEGKYDVLLSTNIIESGLDIPTANTIIINRADLFGLSQLYQMRGRVGRGKLRAYAYFILPTRKMITRNATRRLEVMQGLDQLGAGFTLASHDMDIRGCGNLIGEEQSGHIREVGVELYQQMLHEAVEALKKSQGEEHTAAIEDWSPQINLGITALIPESYIEDLELRLGMYRRASLLQSAEEIHSFAIELSDRFGKQPKEVEQFLQLVEIKLLCKQAGIEKLDVGTKGAVIHFRNKAFVRPEALLNYVMQSPTHLKIRPDMALAVLGKQSITDIKKRLEVITAL